MIMKETKNLRENFMSFKFIELADIFYSIQLQLRQFYFYSVNLFLIQFDKFCFIINFRSKITESNFNLFPANSAFFIKMFYVASIFFCLKCNKIK